MTRLHQKTERTEAEKARIKAVRERFQREKPSPKKLEESGEYNPPIPTDIFFALQSLLQSLRASREAAGLSLSDLAETTGMDKAALSRLETGQSNPTVDTLGRYAQALGKRVVFGVEELVA